MISETKPTQSTSRNRLALIYSFGKQIQISKNMTLMLLAPCSTSWTAADPSRTGLQY